MKKIVYPLLLSAVFIIYFLISLPDYSGDIKNHVVWGQSIWEFGPYGFYDRIFPGFSYPTYPPFIMSLFALCFGLYQNTVFTISFLNSHLPIFPSNLVHFFEWENTKIAFLKFPGIIATILMGALIYSFAGRFKDEAFRIKPFWAAAIFLFNPAVIYLSSIWGQTDVLQYMLLMFAFLLLFKKKIWIAFIVSALALLSKQTIIMLWGIFMLTVLKELGWKKMILGILINFVIFYISYLPFHEPSFYWPVRFYQANFTLVNFQLSENSVNLWSLLFNFQSVESSQKFLSISLDIWGDILFLVLAIPLTGYFYFKKLSIKMFFHYLFLISIIYFFFLSRMHERYLIPGVIFASVLIMFDKKYWINLIFFSFLHFMNLYKGLYVPQYLPLRPLVNSLLFLDFLVVIYGVLIFYNISLFFKSFQK